MLKFWHGLAWALLISVLLWLFIGAVVTALTER